MTYNPSIHHRRSIRLREYDYSWVGWYYVTICINGKKCLFGKVVNDEMVLSSTGTVVRDQWTAIPQFFPSVELDEYVIMPNHIHGIVIQNDDPNRRGLINQTPTREWRLMKNPATPLGKIIRATKARITRTIHTKCGKGFSWQRGFYEHIIRNEADLHRIRTYIANNPLQWALDEENPDNF